MPHSKQIVLVVEDEPILRIAAVDLVENAGFVVVDAGDATEAIAILESRPDIGIVFTDVDMPRGMDGIELAATVRDRWPPIEIIVVSGKLRVRDEDLPDRSVFFSKPYRERQIVETLKRFAA